MDTSTDWGAYFRGLTAEVVNAYAIKDATKAQNQFELDKLKLTPGLDGMLLGNGSGATVGGLSPLVLLLIGGAVLAFVLVK